MATPTKQPTPPTPQLEDGHEARMSFFEHFNELRQRVTRALIGVILGTLVGLIVAEPVLAYLAEPYLALQPDRRLQIIDPTGSVTAIFRVALLIGATLAVPIVTYQAVMFVLPGLTRKERRFFLMSLPSVFGLFVVGVMFAWFGLIPPALGFLQGFKESLFVTEWEAGRYIAFVTTLLFWMGVAFETPLVLFVLSVLGFVRAGWLAKNWRVAVVLAATAAAFITPTVDPVNMTLVMAPLLMLYVISIGLVYIGSAIYSRREDT